jgi:hypothetical protein
MKQVPSNHCTKWDHKGVSFYVNDTLISHVKWPSIWQVIKYKIEDFLSHPDSKGAGK